ncbi:MAG: hydrogenase expression/formation protein HypE [Desulfosarcina sp.]|nr:hydrogenase expression/formation protein HypE [Desulfosarcina sp.]MBC2767802.1 hydrogenase expression/formation protein HypE [Desulfosarcina sp.]
MSKFSLEVLERRVFPFIETEDPDVILGAAFGEDVALTQVGGDVLISHVDPIVGAIGNIGWLAVHVACNDVATSGAPPRWILLLVLVPTMGDEDLLEQIMRDANRAAKEIGVSIIGGHTGYTSGLSRPLVAVTALGSASGRKLVRTSGAQIGDHVLVTKSIALEGTAILAQDFRDIALKLGLRESDIEKAHHLIGEVSVVPEALALAKLGATAIHDVTRGGLLETLLEIAHLSGVGIEVDDSRLPTRPVVARFAQAFQFDPLRMISSGTLAATVPPDRVKDVKNVLTRIGVLLSDVGQVTDGVGVRITRKEESIHYRQIRCEEDELARMWNLYPRNE